MEATKTLVLYPDQEKPHPAFDVHKVLDYGFVRLVDAMPSPTDPHSISADDAIAQAARVSYGKGTKTVNENKGLINYLMKHRHTTPFEMVEMKFHCRMPMFVARQWIRHRTASVNEYSARYSEVPEIAYIPDTAKVLGQSKLNKQASDGELDEAVRREFVELLSNNSRESHNEYESFLRKGVSREIARTLLSVNFYTEWYWKIDLHNLFHFLSLRADSHAQYEIRVFAEKMLETCRSLAPLATEAFENHRMKSVTFSGDEIETIQKILTINPHDVLMRLDLIATENKWSERKKKEFAATLSKLLPNDRI